MQRVSKLQAESLRLCGFKVIKTKRKYYLLGNAVATMTGYVDFL